MHSNEVDIITLGCSKNLVDAERLMRQLELAGYKCVHDSDDPHGEIAVINTCGFIGDAKEESIRTILQFAERKKQHKLRRLYVMGCLSERYRADLEAELPEVDKYYGKFDFLSLVEELKEQSTAKQILRSEAKERTKTATLKEQGCAWERTLTTPAHYAYVKISEGCNRFCSYCAIPLITGRHTPRPQQEIVDEVRWLAAQGVREVQVIAQDLSAYPNLPELVERMSDVPGIDWIRLHYAYPADFPLDLLRVMRERENVCKYLDLALQHNTNHMLKMMRRHITAEEQENLLRKIRAEVPGIHIRTTLMVGHPDETEEDFEALCEFTKRMRFERMGAFAFSAEEGTYAYNHYQDNVPEDVKQQRLDTLMSIQERIATEISEAKVGQTLRVIIDREESDYYVGRTEWDSPEVDCEVLVQKDQPLRIGEFYQVLITDSENFDLIGKADSRGSRVESQESRVKGRESRIKRIR